MDNQRERNLFRQLETWYATVDFNKFVSEIEERVIGQEEVRIVLANIYNYIGNLVDEKPVNNNMILAAPSGSGKTETYRAIKEYFGQYCPAFPVYIVDVSQLTAAGFRGMDPADILAPFYRMHMVDAIGICFLDEFDKKLVSLRNSDESDINREAQSNLLTVIEGSEVQNKQGAIVDTTNLMFVALGSFDAYRERREVPVKHLGFGAGADEPEVKHFDGISAEDMVKHGGTNELIGRFPLVVNYGTLSKDAVSMILAKITIALCDSLDCDITFEEEMEEALYAEANSKFGCRAFDAMIRNIVMRTYARAIGARDNEHLVITVKNKKEADFKWRAYTDEEKSNMSSFMDFDDYTWPDPRPIKPSKRKATRVKSVDDDTTDDDSEWMISVDDVMKSGI